MTDPRFAALALFVAACSETRAPAPTATSTPVDLAPREVAPGSVGSLALAVSGARATERELALVGGTIVGRGPGDVIVKDGVLTEGRGGAHLSRLDVTGRFLAPAFIDAHVHLAFLPKAAELAAGGIAAAVDLGSPLAFLEHHPTALRLVLAGPLLTAPAGYPTTSWGAGGYGLEITTPAQAIRAVDGLHSRGARILKVAVTEPPALADETLRAAIDRAHALGMPVAAHALDDVDALRAAAVGADVLAHAPVGHLSEATVSAWRGKAVISTLAAFDGRGTENLERLRRASVTVLYGTDFGNTNTTGISGTEITALVTAGLDGAAIVRAGTSSPAQAFGLHDLGALEPGRAASILVLDADPRTDPMTLSRPVAVFLEGRRVDGGSRL